MNSIERVEAAINALKSGDFVVLMDEESRENEGDLVIAAEKVTAEKVNFMISQAKGLICISLSQPELERLDLPQMVTDNQDAKKTRFTVSVDSVLADTGISAGERADTLRRLVDSKCGAKDFSRPGHIFPIAVDPEGIQKRRGHTEASFELVNFTGLTPGAVICEIINKDGTMARENDLKQFSKEHNLVFLKISDILEYKSKNNL